MSADDQSEELEFTIELDEDAIRLRQWIEQQMLAGRIGTVAAMRLSYAAADYRRATHLKELGFTDDAILDQMLDE